MSAILSRASLLLNRPGKPWWFGLVGFLLGTLFGLVVLGWIVWPVQYLDTTPAQMRSDIQMDYLRMAVDSYAIENDANLARSRFDALGPGKWNILEQLQLSGLENPDRLQQFNVLLAIASGDGSATGVGSAGPVSSDSGGVMTLIVILGVLILGSGGMVIAMNYRRRNASAKEASPRLDIDPTQPEELSWEAEEDLHPVVPLVVPPPATASSEETEPLERFVTTYTLGNDLYEDSFTINAPSGEFLGECGVGISEPIGVGGQKKVTAFEIWLFDKKPSRTSTVVLMSKYAYEKEDIRSRLAPRGKPVLVDEGSDIWMETPSLQLRAVVRSAAYGQGPLPSESYFERLTLQLEIWSRAKALT